MPRLRIVCACVILAATVALIGELLQAQALASTAIPAWCESSSDGGTLVVRDGLAFAELSGSAAERGRQLGRLAGIQTSDLLALMGLNPLPTIQSDHLGGCIAAISHPESSRTCSRWNAPNSLSTYFISNPAPLSRT